MDNVKHIHVQLKLSEEEHQIVSIYQAINKLSSKPLAIKQMIMSNIGLLSITKDRPIK